MIGLDIGGANLKLHVLPTGESLDVPFALWRHPDQLAERVADLIESLKESERCKLAVTMTGELADCFSSRRQGVNHIVEQTMRAATRCGIESAVFYGTDGQFHAAEQTADKVDLLAASNWHALARAVATTITRSGLLVDIGSTTTDIIAIQDGRVRCAAKTDHQRLIDQSLVYVGCRRTPVCALVETLDLRKQSIAVMKEVFATIDDARLWTGDQIECPDDLETADGKPRTRPSAKSRIARMLGLDADELDDDQVTDLSHQIIAAASSRITAAIQQHHPRCGGPLILSGHGQSMLSIPAEIKTLDLRARLGPGASRCAPSWAVATLALGWVPWE